MTHGVGAGMVASLSCTFRREPMGKEEILVELRGA